MLLIKYLYVKLCLNSETKKKMCIRNHF